MSHKWPIFAEDEIAAVAEVLRSGRVNQWTGEHVRLFEEEFATFHGVRHAIALANGTVALELALRVLGIGPGDEVITTPRTFVGTAGAIVFCGARPVFADVDLTSQNITADSIARVITTKTKAIIPVHLAGWPCEMDKIMALAKAHGLWVIEDCAQAHGAMYQGKPVGAWGHMAAFSFCQDKIMTTGGEGGMLLMDDEVWWRHAWSFKDHGKSYDLAFNTEHPPGFRWLHASFGTNWRMTEMQAAIGRLQLKKLPAWLAHRGQVAREMNAFFKAFSWLRVTEASDDIVHAYYKYYVFLQPEAPVLRDEFIDAFVSANVPCFVGSCSEIYLEKCFESLGPFPRLPCARQLGESSVMFLTDPSIEWQPIIFLEIMKKMAACSIF